VREETEILRAALRREAIVENTSFAQKTRRVKAPVSQRRARIVDEQGATVTSDLDEFERKALVKLLSVFTLGCCSQRQCESADHRHQSDITELGRVFERIEFKENGAAHQCEMPPDPHTDASFRHSRHLSSDAETGEQKLREMTSFLSAAFGANNNNNNRMTADNDEDDPYAEQNVAALLMRLRRQYCTELANIRATYERARLKCDTHYEEEIAYARTTQDDRYGDEALEERDHARNLARAVADTSLSTLDEHIYFLTVQTLAQCAMSMSFALPMPVVIKACVDVIKLQYSTPRTDGDGLFNQLFIQIIAGSLDRVESEKKAANGTHALPFDAYLHEAQEAEFPPDLSRSATAASSASTGSSEAQTTSPKKRKHEEIGNEKPRPSRIEFPCKSQFAMGNARHACTAIAFFVAMRLVTAHMLPIAEMMPISEVIFTQLDYGGMLEAAAKVWNEWWSAKSRNNAKYKASSDANERKKYDASDFMLAVEVPPASEHVVNYMEKYTLKSTEFSGFWVADIAHFSAEDGAPTLERALADAEAMDVFGAILTVNGSSMCVAHNSGHWFVFDSHGVDRSGFSSLFEFGTLADVVRLVRNTFEAVVELDGDVSEFRIMQSNTYSLYVLHF
jgi:hypothetical protein